MPSRDPNHVRPVILGVPFDPVSLTEAVERAAQAIRQRQFCHVVTPGPEFIMAAQSHPAFAAVLRRAELSLADGYGVILAARLLGDQIPRRVTGNDFLDGVLQRAVSAGWRVAFFGARPGVVEAAAATVLQRYPGLMIVGVESGFRGGVRLPDAAMCARIRRAQADLLFVALGAPAQELWIERNRHRLGSVMVAAGVGGAFDFLAGTVRRAPVWWRQVGFEWLWRMVHQPWRWRRIGNAVWRFPLAVLRERYRFSHA